MFADLLTGEGIWSLNNFTITLWSQVQDLNNDNTRQNRESVKEVSKLIVSSVKPESRRRNGSA